MPKDSAVCFAELRQGALEWLREHPGTVNTILEEKEGCEESDLQAWEAQHGQYLPEDLKEFYLLTDGLKLRWDVVAHGREVMPLGCIAINSLAQLRPAGAAVLRNERDELRPSSRSEPPLQVCAPSPSTTRAKRAACCCSSAPKGRTHGSARRSGSRMARARCRCSPPRSASTCACWCSTSACPAGSMPTPRPDLNRPAGNGCG